MRFASRIKKLDLAKISRKIICLTLKRPKFMKEFIAYIVKNLVDLPDQVIVNVFEGQSATIVEIQVADQDIAKLVGRQGRIIKSLRTIVTTVGARFGRKVKVELLQSKVPA